MEINKGISILLTAWQTQDYIEECLDSIENQTYFKNNDNFEVLLGIDACEDTLTKVKEIKHKYRNLKIFMMESNKGTYITTNTLIDIAKYDNLLRFDTDDVMMPIMVEELMKLSAYDVIRFQWYRFNKFIQDTTRKTQGLTHGAIFINKKVFNVIGGYQPWVCAADTELLDRIKNRFKIFELKRPLFYFRNHSNALTNKKDTGFGSAIRNKYRKQIKVYGFNENIYIERVVNKYVEINGINIISRNVEKNNVKKENVEHINEQKITNLTTIKYYSVVIPTMWKCDKIHKMLPIYEKSSYVKEIIIIDNEPTLTPNLSQYKKIRYYTKGENIFVNPAWNWGYSLANYELILANDDIIIYNLDEVLQLISNSNYDIIGLDLRKDNHGMRIDTIDNFLRNGYGCFMYIKNYICIPENIKIWCGDNILFDINKKRGALRNINIEIVLSATLNRNKKLKEIALHDKYLYKQLNSSNKNLNIIIRTSNRPNYFYNCIDSIKKCGINAKLHITIDNLKDLEYVEKTCKGLDYVYYLINKEIVKDICKKIKIERKSFIYNFYFNIIKPYLMGWCLILDDDDKIVLNPVFDKNTKNIYLYKVDVGIKIVPSEKNFGKKPVLNDINSSCIIWHSSQMVNWKPQRGGDYDFITELYKKYTPIWNNTILSAVQTDGNFGKRNDLTYKINNMEVNKGISILLTAWQTQDYIEECLDSIENQTYFKNNDNFEVLLGIDACEDTLTKVKEIMHKYRNLSVFMMDSNKGTYVTTNTLIDIAKYDNLLRFDTDDVMMPIMIEELMKYKNYDIVRFKFLTFNDYTKNAKLTLNVLAVGAVYFDYKIFEKVGGYKNWLCAADKELLERIKNITTTYNIQQPLFYMRMHNNNLTIKNDTKMGSTYRNNLHKQIRNYNKNESIKIERITNNYMIINKNINLLYMITTYNRLNFLKKTINTWEKTKNNKYNWTLIIADDNSTDGTVEYLDNLIIDDVKIIIIKNNNRGVHHQDNQLLRIASHLNFDFGFKSDDDIIFLKPGWDNLYYNAYKKTGYEHFIFYDKMWGSKRNVIRKSIIKYDILENCVSSKNLQGAFWTFTKKIINIIGYEDTNKFGLTGLGHVDFSIRCCRMNFNDINNPFDIKDSNNYIKLNTDSYISSCKYSNYWSTFTILKEKYETLDQNRIFIPYNENNKQLNGNFIVNKIPKIFTNNELNYINEYFDHIYCVNLDRRLDKWQKVQKNFNKLNIIVEKFSAIDGNNIEESELKKYKKINKYEIGCILSHYAIIEDAQKNNYRKILILEDDVLFINNFNEKFINLIQHILNWKLLYLGASQWKWDNIEIKNNLYYTHKTDGTFAYAIDQSIYDEILDTKVIIDKPMDGKLWDIQKKYYKQCYTCFPNLIIADVSDSNIRQARNNEIHRKKMKWDLFNYK